MNLNLQLLKNKDITQFFTLKTKTSAEFFLEAKTREDLISAKKYSLEKNIPLLILAGGSNIVVTKEVIPGLVVKNNYSRLKIISDKSDNILLSVSSGYPVSRLVNETIEKGWGGLQYYLGLPGTVGGAIFNNSKWTRPLSYFGDNLIEAYLVDESLQIKKVDRKYFRFSYDFSVLHQTKEIILEVVFQLKKTDPALLKKQAKEVMAYRIKTQPQGVFTSGCFFKNISDNDQKKLNLPTKSSGYLIDKAGLKGFNIGRFFISDKHANFIINQGGGNPEELKKLVKIIKNKVKIKFGVKLEEEVIIV